jgi:hypothetical protein
MLTITRGGFENFIRAFGRPAERDGVPDPSGPPTSEQAEVLACRHYAIELVGPLLSWEGTKLGLPPCSQLCSRRRPPSQRIQFFVECALIITIPEPYPKQFDPLDAVLHAQLLNEALDFTSQRGRHNDEIPLDLNAFAEYESTGDQVIFILNQEAIDRLRRGLATKELATTYDVEGLFIRLSVIDQLWGTIFHEFLFYIRMGIGST